MWERRFVLAPLNDLAPDLIFVHTGYTLTAWPQTSNRFFSVTIDEIEPKIRVEPDWRKVQNPVRRAPLVTYEFLREHSDNYRIVAVYFASRYWHLYAIRNDGRIAYDDFVEALSDSFAPENRLSYWEMQRLRRAQRN